MTELSVHGKVDRSGRLIDAEPQLLALQHRAGGEANGTIAVPQIATLARLSQRLGIVISRAVIAADGDHDLDLWVRAQPDGDAVRLTIGGWTKRPAHLPAAEPELDRETDFLRSTADWLWEVDENLKIIALSASAEVAIGGPVSGLIGQPLTKLCRLVENDDGDLPLLAALAAQHRFDTQDAEMRGSETPIRLSAVPLLDGEGRFRGFRGSASWRKSQVPLGQEASVDAIPDAFGERLDRALRQPLDRIIASADNIGAQREGPLRQDYAEYAGDIATAGRHLLALVDDLVDLQAIERPDFRPDIEEIDLADVARRAAGLLIVRAGDRSVKIERPHVDVTLPAHGEFRRTLQILVNLIGNAVRFSPEGASVTVECSTLGQNAAIIVSDQGKGIDPQFQEQIFQKFERLDDTDPSGSGLGLYIARRLARAMDGEIAVESTPGQGARFILTLPQI